MEIIMLNYAKGVNKESSHECSAAAAAAVEEQEEEEILEKGDTSVKGKIEEQPRNTTPDCKPTKKRRLDSKSQPSDKEDSSHSVRAEISMSIKITKEEGRNTPSSSAFNSQEQSSSNPTTYPTTDEFTFSTYSNDELPKQDTALRILGLSRKLSESERQSDVQDFEFAQVDDDDDDDDHDNDGFDYDATFPDLVMYHHEAASLSDVALSDCPEEMDEDDDDDVCSQSELASFLNLQDDKGEEDISGEGGETDDPSSLQDHESLLASLAQAIAIQFGDGLEDDEDDEDADEEDCSTMVDPIRDDQSQKDNIVYSEAEKRAHDCLALALRKTFLTKYVVSHILGFGCNGVVVSAALLGGSPADGNVAVKIIYKQSEARDRRHCREIDILQQLHHPNIIRFLEWGQDELFFYLVSEAHGFNWDSFAQQKSDVLDSNLTSADFLSPLEDKESSEEFEKNQCDEAGVESVEDTVTCPEETGQFAFQPGSFDLFSFLENSPCGKASLSDTRTIMRQIVSGVQYLHSRSIIHGDLKEENILVAADLSIKLCDFGHAFYSDDQAGCSDLEDTLDADHTTYGTAEFCAPELLHPLGVVTLSSDVGKKGDDEDALLPHDPAHTQVSKSSDVWACGLLCYTLLSGSLSEAHDMLMMKGGIFSLSTYPLEPVFTALLLHTSTPDMTLEIAPMLGGSEEEGGRLAQKDREVELLMDFLSGMLAVSPSARRTADELLQHPWLLL